MLPSLVCSYNQTRQPRSSVLRALLMSTNWGEAMKRFLEKQVSKITVVLSCFDRTPFRNVNTPQT